MIDVLYENKEEMNIKLSELISCVDLLNNSHLLYSRTK